MSLLLDALNKADQDRKRNGENPNISSNHDVYNSAAATKSPAIIKLLLAGIALAVLLFAVYWLGKKNQPAPNELAATNNAVQPAPATNHTAASTASSITAASQVADDIAAASPTPVPDAAADQESITSLYQNQAQANAIAAASPREQAQPKPTVISEPAINELPTTVTPQSTTSLATGAPLTLAAFANLPGIQDLPSSVSQRIPSLKYTEHNYKENGGSVVINGMVKHTDEQIVAGVVIDKILKDGMVLHFENYSFKMPAMNTWINM